MYRHGIESRSDGINVKRMQVIRLAPIRRFSASLLHVCPWKYNWTIWSTMIVISSGW
jgi:hypothetical protein